jgi:DNA-binding transcriptional regulator YiaG
MTPVTLREIIECLGVTQGRFAQLVGVHPRTVRQWLDRANPTPIPRSVQALAILLNDGDLTIEGLRCVMLECG